MTRSVCFILYGIIAIFCNGYDARIVGTHSYREQMVKLQTSQYDRFFDENNNSWLRPKEQRNRVTLVNNENNENIDKGGFLSSASNAVVAIVAALGFIGGTVVAIAILFGIVALCRYLGCKQFESCGISTNKSNSDCHDDHPTPETKRSTSTASSTTSTFYTSPLPRRKLPGTLSKSDLSETNTNDSKSILSFLESAGRAYNTLNGVNDKGSNRTIDDGKNKVKVNIDIAGMSIDSSDFAQSDAVIRLGGGQYNRDGSIASLPTMSDMYPDDEGS